MTDISELFEAHPSVARRLADRIGEFIRSQPDDRQLDLETAGKPIGGGINDHGTVVVTVQFWDGDRIIGECNFDGTTVGLHAVAGEVVVLEDDQ